jgi:hypothetical protein
MFILYEGLGLVTKWKRQIVIHQRGTKIHSKVNKPPKILDNMKGWGLAKLLKLDKSASVLVAHAFQSYKTTVRAQHLHEVFTVFLSHKIIVQKTLSYVLETL